MVSPIPSFQVSSWIEARSPHPSSLSAVLGAPLRPVLRAVPFPTPVGGEPGRGPSGTPPGPLRVSAFSAWANGLCLPSIPSLGHPRPLPQSPNPPCPALGEALAEPRRPGAWWCGGRGGCPSLGSGGRCSPRLGADLSGWAWENAGPRAAHLALSLAGPSFPGQQEGFLSPPRSDPKVHTSKSLF